MFFANFYLSLGMADRNPHYTNTSQIQKFRILQELYPPPLSMRIKTFCPKIDKQCLPTRIYLNDIRVKTLFIIYFF